MEKEVSLTSRELVYGVIDGNGEAIRQIPQGIYVDGTWRLIAGKHSVAVYHDEKLIGMHRRMYGVLPLIDLEAVTELMATADVDCAEVDTLSGHATIERCGDRAICGGGSIPWPRDISPIPQPEDPMHDVAWYNCLDPIPHVVLLKYEFLSLTLHTPRRLYCSALYGWVRVWVDSRLVYRSHIEPGDFTDDYWCEIRGSVDE